ncbi:hypothetical protein ACQP25_13710 [Microtetraspora malaysiensis]|uniref:hypothetical protein n=1 Tax=Microtetraspora malaysiensis TaxID=161358 RepID=UPI003D90D7AA
MAVTDGPVGMLPLMAGTLVRASEVMARPLAVIDRALVGMARTVWARPPVVIAG